ncbi:permease [Rhodobacterales bacterium 52_120_T64]|nr:permease [Rhodobacterales bacterium 52_120_T64]
MSDLATPTPNGPLKLLSPLWSPWGMIVLILALVALLAPTNMGAIINIAIRALAGTAPYILFAVVTIAYLSASGAEAIIANVFKGREYRMIVLAALVGGLAPFCSCEVIPFIAGLLAMGVPLGPVMAFWLASPLVDPPSLLITAGALGWNFAIAKAITAVLLGLTGGFIVSFLVKTGAYKNILRPRKSAGCGCGPSPIDQKPVWKFWTESARRTTFINLGKENLLFLLKWMSLAYLLEALMITYVPADLIAGILGGEGPKPVILSALIGAPAYLNGYIAPPLLAGLMEQGMTAGAAMAFMVAGAVSSIPAMTAVWSLVKPRVFFTYMSLGIFGAMVAGFAFGAIA